MRWIPLVACLLAGCDTDVPPPDDPGPDGCADEIWYEDADGDGYGDRLVDGCDATLRRAADGGDCDDHDVAVYPGAAESPCDDVDHDCDGLLAPAAFVRGQDTATVAEAVAAAVDGDEVRVCPGSWPAQLEIPIGRELTLRSHSGDPADTTLDGGGTAPVIHAWDASRLAVEGLTLRAGLGRPQDDGTDGAGGVHSLGTSLRIANCRFVDNRSADAGGAVGYQPDPCVAALGPALTIEDSRFEENHGGHGGALSVVAPMDVGVTIRGCVFRGNEADGHGGAIALAGARAVDALIASSSLTSNTAGGDGGGLFAGSTGRYQLTLWEVELRANECDGEGGGMAFKATPLAGDDTIRLDLQGCLVEGNRAAGKGGGLHLRGALDTPTPMRLLDSAVIGNDGGGVYLYPRVELTGEAIEWGAGVDANDPWDLVDWDVVYADLGYVDSFSCDDDGCVF